jgi:hypothetical protein
VSKYEFFSKGEIEGGRVSGVPCKNKIGKPFLVPTMGIDQRVQSESKSNMVRAEHGIPLKFEVA